MSGDPTPYLSLITSEHASRPNFIASVTASLQPLADQIAVLNSIPGLYDLDVAEGQQLDVTGQWIGASRDLSEPLRGVYFSFDTAGVGFDQGVWLGPFDPTTGVVALDDDHYRILLRATIAANQWDGTVPGAYAVWSIIFPESASSLFFEGSGPITFVGTGPIAFGQSASQLLLQDFGDMSILIGFTGQNPDAVTLALLANGFFALKPAGVKLLGYVVPSVSNNPFFGFDAMTDAVSGFDAGCWPDLLTTI